MQSVFEKIIEKLEERASFLSDCTKYGNKDAEQQNKSYSTMMMYEVADLVDDLIEIVNQEAEEYNNCWISCSERLPEEKDGTVIICCEDGMVITGTYSEFSHTWYKGEMCGIGGSNVIAWQPLPEPYNPNGE